MPFTPFHVGPVLLIYGILVFLDPIALIYGSVLVDLEPVIVMFFLRVGTLHGPAHSIVGVMLLLPLIYVATLITRRLFPLADSIFIPKGKKFTYQTTVLSILIGVYSHLILDSFLYPELNLVWPLPYWNPLLHQVSDVLVYDLCMVALVFGFLLVLLRGLKR